MHLTSHQRLVVAMRHGVLVKSERTMKWTADVVHLNLREVADRQFSVTPIEAVNEMDAAREAARIAAQQAYGELGTPSFVNGRGPGLFLACIGLQQSSAIGGVTRGSSVSIKVRAA